MDSVDICIVGLNDKSRAAELETGESLISVSHDLLSGEVS